MTFFNFSVLKVKLDLSFKSVVVLTTFTSLGSKNHSIKLRSPISHFPGGNVCNVWPIVDPAIKFLSTISTISSWSTSRDDNYEIN